MSAFDSEMALTQRVLDAVAVRSKVAMHNIANQNTPGFKRYTVAFEDELRAALERGRDVQAVHPRVTRDTSGPQGQNNVSVADELALLDKVKMVHDVFSRRAGGYLAHLSKAIRGQ